ncbi:condensation domain-containing protein [Streptomyces sp. NPDC015171]|uniref:condensation domain-containing protein n=1 Tax=Streptomyces sp. NPDC015171 TaxID=3364945 RepID=UPI003700CBFF
MTKTTDHSRTLVLPLSSRQEWCWEWDRCYDGPYPSAVSLDCSTALRLLGPLDTGALRDAFAEVTLHHDALRLRLDGDRDLIAGVVRPQQTLSETPLPLEEAELPDVPPALLVDLSTRPFPVTERLGRADLLRAAPDHHILLTSFHHLVFDAASHHVFLRDLAGAYNSRVPGGAGGAGGAGEADGTAPRPAFSYLDLVRAENTPRSLEERALRLTERARLLRAYGSGDLLPGRTPGPPALRHRYDEEPFELSARRTGQLLHAARAARVSLYSLLAAAFATALGRHFGRDRLILSTPSHGRLRPEHHSAIGDFANMVQIPLDLSHGGGRGMLRHAHEAVREAAAAVDLPYGRLAETVLGRSGTDGFFRYALAHAELRLHGVTGWALDPQGDDAFPMHGLRTDVLPMHQDFSRLTYATRQSSDAAAATLSLSLTMTPDGRLTGALRHETTYHGPHTAHSVLNHLQEHLTALATPSGA